MNPSSILNWTFRLAHIFGLEIRVHWSCFIFIALAITQIMSSGLSWYWLPVLALVPFVSVLVHELGHAFMARLVGGDAPQVIMWALGGLASYAVPPSPGRRFAVAAAGPVVSFIIYALCSLSIRQDVAVSPEQTSALYGALVSIVGWIALVNLALLLFNLLPAYPLDGGAMLRAALWPLLGLSRAVQVTIIVAYVVIGILVIWAMITSNILLFSMGLLLLFSVIQEHVARKNGIDLYLGLSPDFDPAGPSLLANWRDRRRAQNDEKEAQRLEKEQGLLDVLLDKVSKHGLPSLTKQERAMLKKMSDEQKKRQERR